MANGYDTMMKPPIEGLLQDAGSKFRLVTLSATRSREITSYFGQLSGSMGAAVPPQVESTSVKPLSRAFEEIAARKIVAADVDPAAEPEPALDDMGA